MSHRTESITVEVTGTNPDELLNAAYAHALKFWGSSDGLHVEDLEASPHILAGTGQILDWQATITVTKSSSQGPPRDVP